MASNTKLRVGCAQVLLGPPSRRSTEQLRGEDRGEPLEPCEINTTCERSFFGVIKHQAKMGLGDIKHQGPMKDDDTHYQSWCIMIHFEMSIRSCEFACFTKGLHLVRHCAAWGKALISVRRPSFCKFSSSLQHIILQGSTGVKPLRCERKLIGGLVDVGNECKGQIQAWKQAGNLTNFAGQVPLQRRPCHAGSLFHHSKRILQRRSEKWRCSGIAGPKKGEKMIEHEMYCWFEYLLWNIIIIIIWRCGESSKWPARCASSFKNCQRNHTPKLIALRGSDEQSKVPYKWNRLTVSRAGIRSRVAY